jgi:hypothetical protein
MRSRVFVPLADDPASLSLRPVALGALEVWWTMASHRWQDFRYILGSFNAFFGMVRQRRNLEVKIPIVPCSDSAPSTGRWRLEFCVQQTSCDLVVFLVCSSGCWSASPSLWFSTLVMVSSLVHWCFRRLACCLSVCLL